MAESQHAQGLKETIVVVHVGPVKIYVAALEALRKKKDRVKLRNHQN